MNVIDKSFYELVNHLGGLSEEQIYNNIKASFDLIPEQTKFSLEDYFNKFKYWGELNLQTGNYDQLIQKAKSFSEHLDDYVWLYKRLKDYRSKKLLFAIMNNWYRYDFISLSTSHEVNYNHYFDLDLINANRDDVFVDLGAYTGDTIIDYIRNYGEAGYKRIYGYEITDSSYKILESNILPYENIMIRKKAASDEKGIMYVNKSVVNDSANTISTEGTDAVETVTIDEDIKEAVSIIKMDIEGAEQKALIGCKNHIINEHPKLLLSVYHNNEDIWKIPRMIENICPGYDFYLRSYGGNIYPTEIVLIAIYNEKSNKQ